VTKDSELKKVAMKSMSGVTETFWDAEGDFSLAQKPNHSLVDVNTGMCTPCSLKNTVAFGRVFDMLVAGLALCYVNSN
jgi:hypothetical protein